MTMSWHITFFRRHGVTVWSDKYYDFTASIRDIRGSLKAKKIWNRRHLVFVLRSLILERGRRLKGLKMTRST